MHKNVDVLLWEMNDIALTVRNCLQSSTNITLFDKKHTFAGFLPDIVLLTQKDIINALKARLDALKQYPNAKIIHIKQTVDLTVVSIAMLTELDGLISLGITKYNLEKVFLTLGEASQESLTQRRRSRMLVDQFKDYNKEGFTFRQLAILCGLVRNLKHSEIAELLNTSKGDVFINECMICKKLKVSPEDLHTPEMIKKYGAIEVGLKYKTYIIPAHVKRPGYYIIPRFYE